MFFEEIEIKKKMQFDFDIGPTIRFAHMKYIHVDKQMDGGNGKGPVIIYDRGEGGGNSHFTRKLFKAHLACRQNISRPTRHRLIVFRCPLLENTIIIILQGHIGQIMLVSRQDERVMKT